MLVEDLKEYLQTFNSFDVPEIEFNDLLFKFTVSSDGFLVLGPGEEAVRYWK